jgi:hypothetical protein
MSLLFFQYAAFQESFWLILLLFGRFEIFRHVSCEEYNQRKPLEIPEENS